MGLSAHRSNASVPANTRTRLKELSRSKGELVTRGEKARWHDHVGWRMDMTSGVDTIIQRPNGGLSGVHRGEKHYRFWFQHPDTGAISYETVDEADPLWQIPYFSDRHALFDLSQGGVVVHAFGKGTRKFLEGLDDARSVSAVFADSARANQVYLLTNKAGVGLTENRLARYDLETGKVLAQHAENPDGNHIRYAATAADGGFWSLMSDHSLVRMDANLKITRTIDIGPRPDGHFDTTLFEMPDGKVVIGYGGADKRALKVVDPKARSGRGKDITVDNPSGWAQWVDVAGVDDHTIAVHTPKAAMDQTPTDILLIDLRTGDQRPLAGHQAQIRSVHPVGGGRLLSFGADQSLILWDVASGKVLARKNDFTGELISQDPVDAEGTIFVYQGERGSVHTLDVDAL